MMSEIKYDNSPVMLVYALSTEKEKSKWECKSVYVLLVHKDKVPTDA